MASKGKRKIYFARYYRHLRLSARKNLLFAVFFILPLLILLIVFMDEITDFICDLAVDALAEVFPGIPFYIRSDPFSVLGRVEYVDLPSVYPEKSMVLINLIICLVLLLLCCFHKWKARPLAIYAFLNTCIHTLNSIYFFFAANDFPMEAVTYSSLYVKQQVGIWIAFLVLGGLCTGLVADSSFFFKAATCLCILGYSLVFGSARYIVFLFILEKCSILYIAVLYFVVGPILDFLYFVIIYAKFINRMIDRLDSGQERSSWEWS